MVDQMQITNEEQAKKRLQTLKHNASYDMEYHHDDDKHEVSLREEQAKTEF